MDVDACEDDTSSDERRVTGQIDLMESIHFAFGSSGERTHRIWERLGGEEGLVPAETQDECRGVVAQLAVALDVRHDALDNL